MKVIRQQAIAMFVALGFKVAHTWDVNKLKAKIEALPTVIKADTARPEDKDLNNLLTNLLSAATKEEDIEIVEGEAAPAKKKAAPAPAAEVEEEEEAPAPKKKAKAAPAPAAEEEEEEEAPAPAPKKKVKPAPVAEEEEEVAETPAKAPKKAAAAAPAAEEEGPDEPAAPAPKKKKGSPPVAKGPGVISTIVELLKAADEETPIAKEAILKKLVKKFPERDADGMKTTISIQVPNRIKSDKKLVVHSNDKGYWINEDGK